MPHDHSLTWPGSSHHAHRLPRWYEWLIAVVLVVAVAGHFVIRPAVESALPGIGQGFAVFLQGISQFA